MKVEELIEQLKQYSKDATIQFYDCLTANDMFLRKIETSYEQDEVYFNISR